MLMSLVNITFRNKEQKGNHCCQYKSGKVKPCWVLVEHKCTKELVERSNL